MLKDRLAYRFLRVFDKIREYSKESLAEVGIAHGSFITLLYISENEGVTQATLAEIQKKDRNVIGRNIDVLEEKGFVIRKRGEIDRRSFSLYLTEEGKNFVENHSNLLIKSEQKALENLSKDEIKTLFILLDKILN